MEKLLKIALLEKGWHTESDPFKERGALLIGCFCEESIFSMRILFGDETGYDIVITNTTVLPYSNVGRGTGSKALKGFFQICQEVGIETILATQVQKQSQNFWVKNGFIRLPDPNPCSDYQYDREGEEK